MVVPRDISEQRLDYVYCDMDGNQMFGYPMDIQEMGCATWVWSLNFHQRECPCVFLCKLFPKILHQVALVAIKTYAHPPETPKPSNLTRYLSEQDQSDLEVDQIQDDDMYGDQAGAVTEEEMEDVLKDSGDEAQKPGMDEMCLLEEAVPEIDLSSIFTDCSITENEEQDD
ncbi:hypothetical protein DAPPUDRAFT_255429 [Daphnia pulex]|uniref:Uncharacterized protein n=1 Tax=Daphnia pulex TaxID=6669 RepID=E9H961_DAPPU|nr:hypothetical protein DAPPUDRAFT_255429 [Daphnia pulex]|eukprot:EFX71736.1 hypothetical protein DAPPUDRAFT_255429 [Daphnia pulex]